MEPHHDDEVEDVIKICPSANELTTSGNVQKNVKCPVDGCDQEVSSTAGLRMHTIKVHKIFKDDEDRRFYLGRNKPVAHTDSIFHYHCPIESCKYNRHSERYFTTMRYLKQHFMKVHGEKKFICSKCNYGFSLERLMRRHEENCGVVYKCETCGCPYSTREALQTHCYRKNHILPVDMRGKRKCDEILQNDQKRQKMSEKSPEKQTVNIYQYVVIPPANQQTYQGAENSNKLPLTTQPRPLLAKTTANQDKIDPPNNDIELSGLKALSTACAQVTQTTTTSPDESNDKTAVKASSTQTSGDYILRKAMQSANIIVQKESRAAQVSHETRRRQPSGTATMQSTSVQTYSETPGKRKRKRRSRDSGGSDDLKTVVLRIPECSSDTSNLGSVSETETQTMALLEELEASLAESISTQTCESFLSKSLNYTTGGFSLSTQTTTETQTPYMDSSMDTNTVDMTSSLLDTINWEVDKSADTNPAPPNIQQTTPIIPRSSILASDKLVSTGSCDISAPSAHIHTQTIDSMFEQILINMETQTPDNQDLTGFYEFTDNETQTGFGDSMDLPEVVMNLSTVETQTALHSGSQNLVYVQSVSTETQTLFPELELDLTDSYTQTTFTDLEKFWT